MNAKGSTKSGLPHSPLRFERVRHMELPSPENGASPAQSDATTPDATARRAERIETNGSQLCSHLKCIFSARKPKRRCFTNGWRNKIKKGEGKKKKEEKRETVEDIGTNTVCC